MTSNQLRRRTFLARTGQLFAVSLAAPTWSVAQWKSADNPFTLGVASGEPAPDGIVLWTRLAPDPLNGGGMPNQAVEVDWILASDEALSHVVKRGKATATPDLGHSVHVEVNGLDPARWYWYRFTAGGHSSITGRTKTGPDARRPLDKLTFAFASCQHYETGYYTAYQHMAEEDVDLVFHLGDYIYEDGGADNRVRKHHGAEIQSLTDYRNRYAQYKLDANLQKVHARFPWVVTPDDHEVDNNYAADKSEHDTPREQFLERRANAYQAYYENMPLRRTSMAHGSAIQLYRRLAFGDLVECSVLDTRQYRTDQPCGDGNKYCPDASNPANSIMGAPQERWLLDGLGATKRRWNLIAQQVLFAKVDRKAGPEEAYSMDQWSGYEAERNRVLKFLHERHPNNPVIITGDIHSNWACDLKLDWKDPKSPTLGVEFVGTSITSGGDGSDTAPAIDAILPENPHVHLYNSQRGYVRCTVTPKTFQGDYRVVPFVSKPGAEIHTRASFVTEANHPGLQKA